MDDKRTRRQFLEAAGAGVAAVSLAWQSGCLGQAASAAESEKGGDKYEMKLGLASYTLRKFDLEQTIEMCKRVGLEYIKLKSFHLPLEASKAEIEEAAGKVREAGLKLYGGGVIYMKNPAQVVQAFNYAKAAGMDIIIGVPMPNVLKLTEEKVKEYDIKVAVHNHGPGDETYPTPERVYETVKDLDKRIGLCIDIGHTKRYGADSSEAAKKYKERLFDVDMKDVSEASAEGTCVEVGRGVVDVPRVLRTLKEIRYEGVVAFEHEKDADDPLAGLAESVGYVRGILAVI